MFTDPDDPEQQKQREYQQHLIDQAKETIVQLKPVDQQISTLDKILLDTTQRRDKALWQVQRAEHQLQQQREALEWWQAKQADHENKILKVRALLFPRFLGERLTGRHVEVMAPQKRDDDASRHQDDQH